MNRNTYHVIASHSKLTCDKQSQQERSMEHETTAKVYTKDLNLVRAFMVKNGIVKTADGIRVAIEYANAHGAFK
jgi:hypothetical protein